MAMRASEEKVPAGKCGELTAYGNGFHFKQCGRPVISSDGKWCGIHDPVARERRRKSRGPTRFEREIAQIRAREKELSLLRSVVESSERYASGVVTDSDGMVWWGGDSWGEWMNARAELAKAKERGWL
jgi:hypothetical protein